MRARTRGTRVLHALTAAVLAAGSGALLAGCSSLPGPTDVRLFWAGTGSARTIRVAWSEATPLANRVYVQAVLAQSPTVSREIPASAANAVELPPSAFPEGTGYRVMVVGLHGADAVGEPLASREFDTTRPAPPVVTAIHPTATGITVSWKAGATADDYNPSDPLDMSVKQNLYTVYAGKTKSMSPLATGSPSTSATIAMTSPYRFFVQTTNEWGTATGARLSVGSGSVRAFYPNQVTYSLPTQVRGQTFDTVLSCTSYCRPQTQPAPGTRVYLQARVSQTSAWQGVSTAVSNAQGVYAIPMQSPGIRQYRVVAPTFAGHGRVQIGALATPGVIKAQVGVTLGLGSHVAVQGNPVALRVTVLPALSVPVTIQRYSGGAWTTVGRLVTRNGVATGSVNARSTGVLAYRAVVGNTSYKLVPLLGRVSAGQVLTVKARPKPKPPVFRLPPGVHLPNFHVPQPNEQPTQQQTQQPTQQQTQQRRGHTNPKPNQRG